ncbi:MAG: 2-dehydropantoate 2-reductase, partial [Lachnospiraceae bacterium]|nr:2-dehydropantoate 2-reductase [Lachnospiraceae bacterium]
FGEDIVARNLAILDALSADATTSMQRDIDAGKQSEIDGLVYEVVRLGREYGVSLPEYEKIAEACRDRGL